MQPLLRAPRAALIFGLTACAGLLIFALAVGVLMQPAVQKVGMERTAELVCLQVAFAPQRAADIVLGFSEEARIGIAQLLVPGDLALAWGYGLLLVGLMGLLVRRLQGAWLRVGALLMWTPLVATVFDCIENAFLYPIVTGLVAAPESLPPAAWTIGAGIAASIKWLALSVVAPVFGLAAIVRGISTERSWQTLTIAFLLFAVLLSMVMKPIQDLPACF